MPTVHIARQAILDARGHVVGYELLYRGSVGDTACTVEGDVAAASVLTGAVLDLRLDALTDGRTAFINITRSMLLNGVATLLRPSLALFELREDISIDDEVIDACRTLSQSGYRLALDDFVPGSAAEVLLPYVSHVKVDTLMLSRETIAALARRLTSSGITLVAEKVETRDVFEWARDAGCGRPMTEALAELPLTDAARDALLGHPNALRSVLDAVIAYGDGGWEAAVSRAETIGAPESQLQQAYTGALGWAHELTSVGFGA